jgi:dolichol-phosphate mannosyltransferase
MIPTYNERENVVQMLKQLTDLNIPTDILFIDDNSPDGTGKVIDGLISNLNFAHVIHRAKKEGIGTAHYEGIKYAYEKKYRMLITMDCDFTHSPSDIIKFLSYADKYHIVIGSRYMSRNSLHNWSILRKILTYLGHFATRTILKIKHDASGSFRLYRLDRIPFGCFELVRSKGYSFFFESLFILSNNDFSIKEFPIKLSARMQGSSKMSPKDAIISLKFLMNLFYIKLFKPNLVQCPRPK